MSTYDMVCAECQNAFEVYRQGELRDKDKACPQCGSTETRQTLASFLRTFGSGAGNSGCAPCFGGFG